MKKIKAHWFKLKKTEKRFHQLVMNVQWLFYKTNVSRYGFAYQKPS